MAQFMVAGEDDNRLGAAITSAYPDDHIKAWSGVWFVSDDDAIAQQVAAKIGTSDGQVGRVLICTVSGYSGWAPKNVWEWLRVKGTPHHGT